jgi:hypothetical protein
MKSFLFIFLISVFILQFVSGNEDNMNKEDNLSRLLLLNFNYFETPYPLPLLKLSDPNGKKLSLDQFKGQAVVMIFQGENDPFNDEIREQIEYLKNIYKGKPIQFIIISQEQEDYKDFNSTARDALGVLRYPSYFIIDHKYNLRGSAESIYPSLISDDFLKIIERLLLDIESPGIVNTLK